MHAQLNTLPEYQNITHTLAKAGKMIDSQRVSLEDEKKSIVRKKLALVKILWPLGQPKGRDFQGFGNCQKRYNGNGRKNFFLNLEQL